MVTFEKDRFIITVETRTEPTEDWLRLHSSLCHIISNVNKDNIVDDTFFAAVDFLEYLMPDWETAKKMVK